MIYRHFKRLFITKNSNRNDLVKNLKLKPNQTFLVNKYLKQSQMFKTNDLEELLEKFIDLDKNYKEGNIDLQIGLETLLCKYCS